MANLLTIGTDRWAVLLTGKNRSTNMHGFYIMLRYAYLDNHIRSQHVKHQNRQMQKMQHLIVPC